MNSQNIISELKKESNFQLMKIQRIGAKEIILSIRQNKTRKTSKKAKYFNEFQIQSIKQKRET